MSIRTALLACLLGVAGAALCGSARAEDSAPPVDAPQLSAEARAGAETLPIGDLALWVGLPVAQVSLEAPDGGLPRENLEPLLRLRQGQELNLGNIRLDVALLYRAGAFAAVEAVAEPWFIVNEDGEPIPAARIAYRVYPPPKLSTLSLDGVRGVPRRVAQRAIGRSVGEAFYPDTDPAPLEARVRAALAEQGWTEARVSTRVSRDDLGGVALLVTVDPGEARTWSEVQVNGPELVKGWGRRCALDQADCAPRSARVRRVLARHGIHKGRRVVRQALERALEELRDDLVRQGWMQPTVRFIQVPGAGGATGLVLNVETNSRLAVAIRREGSGERMPRAAEVQAVLGLYEGTRASQDTAEQAARRLRGWLDERGHPDAAVALSLDAIPDGQLLTLTARPGPQLRLRRIEVSGAETFSARYVAGAIREADAEGLGQRIVTTAGINRGLAGVREFYRGQGYLDARLEVTEQIHLKRRLLSMVLNRKPTVLQVQVREGQRTLLRELAAEGLKLGDPGWVALESARAELVGQPYQPARIDALARTVTDAWKGRGHLSADARVETRLSPDGGEAVAALVVTPGPQVRLRSVVLQGSRRTRRRVIERELALTLGEPVTPEGIRRTRSNLYALDLFRVVSPELVGDDDRFRDLLIVLDEKPNLLFETGGGLSTDQGIQANARATHRNLGGLGHKITLYGQVGYGWFGDEWRLDLDQPVWQAALRYSAPHFPGAGQQLVVEAILGETLQEPVYRLWRTGLSVGVRATGLRWEGYVGYRAQLRRLEDVETGALVRGDPWLEALGLSSDASGPARLPSAIRFVTGPSLLVLRDGRDDRFNPTKGNFFSGLVEVSDGLGQALVTARSLLRMEQLVPLGPLVLNLGGRVGAGWAKGDATTLPLEDRFYLGGSGSLRGFQLNMVGPANYAARPQIPFPDALEALVDGAGIRGESARWVPTGGDAIAAATVELRVPLNVLGFSDLSSTQWVLFSDFGQVNFLDAAVLPTSSQRGRDQLFRTGLGSGVRIATPVGPAALDLGFNPWPQRERAEQSFVAHLSLGEL